jgi:signal transduction histidine kinase
VAVRPARVIGGAAVRVLVIEDDGELGTALAVGDARLAERLAANLTDNAIRYNVTGGQVEITAGSRDGRPFLVVANTGPVVPPDHLSRLFQPFQRLDPGPRVQAGPGQGGPGQGGPGQGGPSSARGGLGLGLAIVSAIAAAHGAELRAVTRAAGGLVVEVTFPPPPAEADRRAEGPAEALA